MQLLRIAIFELKYILASLPFSITAIMFFGLGFLLTANAGEFLSFSGGEVVLANSPFTISHMLIRLSMLSAFIAPTLIANSILKDSEYQFDAILFSTPINEKDYLHGRFIASFIGFSLCFLAAPVGMYLGAYWPWADQSLLGENQASIYGLVYLSILLPSLLVVSFVTFSVAAMTRSLMFSYIAAILLLGLFFVASFSQTLPVDLDPFMLDRYLEQTQFLTSSELNHQLAPIKGAILNNRLGWIFASLALYCFAIFIFRFDKFSGKIKAKLKKRENSDDPAKSDNLIPNQTNLSRDKSNHSELWQPNWGRHTELYQLKALSRFEVFSVLKSLPFIILFAISLSILLVNLSHREIVHGVYSLPLTSVLLSSFSNLTPAVLGVIVFYSAEIMWRERGSAAGQVIESMPVANWIFVLSKLLALISIIIIIKLTGIVLSLAVQLANNYYLFEFNLYFIREFIYQLIPFICLSILACMFHIIAKTRLLGMMLFGAFIAMIAISRDMLGWEHPLLSYGIPAVSAPMSDMNGNYQFISLGAWMRVYWLAMAGLILMAIYSLWPRGAEQGLVSRIKFMIKPKPVASYWKLAGLLFVWFSSGGLIYYNTNSLNHFLSSLDREQVQADYEKKYIGYAQLPMPKITKVMSSVDLFPHKRELVVTSELELTNKTNQPINTVHFSFPVESTVTDAELKNGTLLSSDPKYKYYIFDLEEPLNPGERTMFKYSLQTQQIGFSGGHQSTNVVKNGSFVMTTQTQPTVGLQIDYFLKENRIRKNYGLASIDRRADWKDETQFNNNVIRSDSDFVDFETVVSTLIGQTAIAQGDLVNQWTNGERAYFHYQSKVPLVNFAGYLSADYELVEETWNDIAIQVFHYPEHHQNISRILKAMRDSLAYYTESFGPYPHQQIRVVEFPGYRTFAKAFPSTIAFSESFGFSADVTDEGLDMPYYIVAHEMAHQWWGNQVIAANVEGDGFIHESFAQYSALMVMEHSYGKDKLREFLEFELERYLKGRAKDPRGENPLVKVASQKHIHYGKGALVFYALKEKVGEAALNNVFKQFFEMRAFSSKPYATSIDFMNLLKSNVPQEHHSIIVDLFEKISLYDFKVVDASIKPLDNGKYEVSVEVETRKFYANPFGEESEQPFLDAVDVGLFSQSESAERYNAEDLIQMESRQFDSVSNQLKIIVSQKPSRVVIDPYHLFIDRELEDNLFLIRE